MKQKKQPIPITKPAPEKFVMHTSTLTHVRPLQKLFTVVVTGPDGLVIARYEQIPGYTKQEAICMIKNGLLLEAHPS